MLIQKFLAPADEVRDVGLNEINMNRLGRFVALAGKNGAGKSRIINKVEFYVGVRHAGLAHAHNRRLNVVNYTSFIEQHPNHENRRSWQQQLEEEQRQLSLTFERVISSEHSETFKAVRFVPKQLNLQDPRQHASRELVSRYSQAKAPGLAGYEQHCLFYVQQLQTRWWNADHQRFSGTQEEKDLALSDYESFQGIIQRLLGTQLDRNLDGEPTLFGKPVPDAGLSDGQKVILQLCVALHAQRSELDNTVFLLDEPENHLHPSAAIDLLKSLFELAGKSQIWVATHSVPLLAYITSVDPMALWYVSNGGVTNAGRHPELVLDSLLGDEERIGQLNAFTGLPAQLAAINYATESLFPPKAVSGGERDPQVTQIHRIVTKLGNGSALSILDYGAGKGRLLEGIGAELTSQGRPLPSIVEYFAFDPFRDNRDICQRVIRAHYPEDGNRYFNSRDEFFSNKEDSSIAVVVMCNVFHEISPAEWLDLFSPQSLIVRALKDDGYLLIVEDQRIPVGEKAHKYGFIVMDTSHLRTLFAVKDDDVKLGLFSSHDYRNDGRLKAHLIAKPLLLRITAETRQLSIAQLKETAKENVKYLRQQAPTYSNGMLNGFWTQQFANSSLFLGEGI